MTGYNREIHAAVDLRGPGSAGVAVDQTGNGFNTDTIQNDLLWTGGAVEPGVDDNPDIYESFLKEEITKKERIKLTQWLTASMRLREFGLNQHRNGIVDDETYEAHKGIIAIVLGTDRARRWWKSIGRIAFNPDFVLFADSFIESQPMTEFFNAHENWLISETFQCPLPTAILPFTCEGSMTVMGKKRT